MINTVIPTIPRKNNAEQPYDSNPANLARNPANFIWWARYSGAYQLWFREEANRQGRQERQENTRENCHR
jgi:hypothetical protein